MSDSWTRLGTFGIGGLTDVGFTQDDKYLLVVGHQGSGVFDGYTGERLARESQATGTYPDEATGMANGIGPIAGQSVAMAGLMSRRALPVKHGDWSTSLDSSGLILTDGTHRQHVPESEEVRAFGFGNEGGVVVLASSSGLTLLRLGNHEA